MKNMNVLEFKKNISTDFREILVSKALVANYNAYVSLKGTRVGLEWADAGDIDASQMTNYIPFKSTGQFFTLFRAGTHIARHIDDSSNRASCLSIALLPSLDNFAPVTYYDRLDDNSPVSETYHYTMQPVILNTTKVHAMYNNEHDRYVFQVQYAEPIDDFIPYSDQE
jgi:hypothetical protein